MAHTAAAIGRYVPAEDEDQEQHHRRIGDDAGVVACGRVAVDRRARCAA